MTNPTTPGVYRCATGSGLGDIYTMTYLSLYWDGSPWLSADMTSEVQPNFIQEWESLVTVKEKYNHDR